MITDYVRAAMRRATYELLEDGEGFYAEVPELPGVWANAQTLEACREELHAVIDSWLLVKLRHNDVDFPVLDGIDLNPAPADQTLAPALEQGVA